MSRSIALMHRAGHQVGEVLVDDDDFKRLCAHTWRKTSLGYAARYRMDGDRKVTIFLHREVMGMPESRVDLVVDHIDGNKANNTRGNLRVCTCAQNTQNQRIRKDNPYGRKGICYLRKFNRWTACIAVNGKTKYLGRFLTAEAAHARYCEAAKVYHGEFARIA